MNLEELKKKSPAELITQAEKLSIENPSTLRKQEILFAILKKLAQKNEQITGGGEGKSAGGRHPVSRTGQSAKGLKTRDNKRTDKYIIRRRKKKRA